MFHLKSHRLVDSPSYIKNSKYFTISEATHKRVIEEQETFIEYSKYQFIFWFQILINSKPILNFWRKNLFVFHHIESSELFWVVFLRYISQKNKLQLEMSDNSSYGQMCKFCSSELTHYIKSFDEDVTILWNQ